MEYSDLKVGDEIYFIGESLPMSVKFSQKQFRFLSRQIKNTISYTIVDVDKCLKTSVVSFREYFIKDSHNYLEGIFNSVLNGFRKPKFKDEIHINFYKTILENGNS